ncbi:hypothetical protein Pcinc_015535 [Petrolisthes cinctipes]|uniref:Uncharacterized protein n=1 Tax=Petrolisthes cinctipes TaxID=88211 RepID=A0AAE1FU92_PETCI|nr:hypothetical protein Pcinc_015535 [Petrolisthes cinctipes]
MVLATAITKTEEVGWDPNHLILPSQSSYLHQDNLALRSTCYVLDHIGFITSLLLVLTMGLAASLAFLRTHSLEEVQSLRGWASASSFRSRYLMHDAQDISFVALTTLTQVSSGRFRLPSEELKPEEIQTTDKVASAREKINDQAARCPVHNLDPHNEIRKRQRNLKQG